MKRTQKYILFLVNLTIMISLCFAGQYNVLAQSHTQAAIEVVSPPLFPTNLEKFRKCSKRCAGIRSDLEFKRRHVRGY